MATPMFSDEVQFVAYTDSSRSGPRVTLRLADRDQLQVFIGKEGKRLACVLVEIGDDEQPVEAEKAPLGPLALWAVQRCKEPEFQAFARNQYKGLLGLQNDESLARSVVLYECGVESRRDLDGDPEIEKRMRALMLQYRCWLEDRQ